MLTKLSLFSGIGGDDLASDWAGIKTIAFVERDKFCQKILAKHWPGIPIIGDVHEVTKEKVMGDTTLKGFRAEPNQRDKPSSTRASDRLIDSSHGRGIDIISGGFPCQPHSVAGKRKAASDERDLWPEFRRIIGEIKPRWVVAENVPGLLSSDAGRFFGAVLSDLAALGYSVGWCTFGAVDVGAWHRRDRVFIVAYASECVRLTGGTRASQWRTEERSENVAYANNKGLQGRDGRSLQECAREWIARPSNPFPHSEDSNRRGTDGAQDGGRRDSEVGGCCQPVGGEEHGSLKSGLGRMVDGLPYWLHEPDGIPRVAAGVKQRRERLKALGNAVVPEQIYPIYQAIVAASGRREEA